MSEYTRAGLIQTAELADQAVTNPKLGAESVGTNKIAEGAVTEAKLGAGAVTTAKIATGAVTTAELGSLAVTGPKIAAEAIGSGKIQDGAVGSGKLGANAVQQSNMNTHATTVSGALGSGALQIDLDPYSFFPMLNATPLGAWHLEPVSGSPGTHDQPRIAIVASGATGYDIRWRAMD